MVGAARDSKMRAPRICSIISDIATHQGFHARSTARLLSCLRGFYRALVERGVLKKDPTAQLEHPKLGRPLPKGLSETDVEALLARTGCRAAVGSARSRHAGTACMRPDCGLPNSSD